MTFATGLIQEGSSGRTLNKVFCQGKKAKKPTDAEVKAQNWLPEAMQFPAIVPGGRDTQEPEESYEAEDYSGEDVG